MKGMGCNELHEVYNDVWKSGNDRCRLVRNLRSAFSYIFQKHDLSMSLLCSCGQATTVMNKTDIKSKMWNTITQCEFGTTYRNYMSETKNWTSAFLNCIMLNKKCRLWCDSRSNFTQSKILLCHEFKGRSRWAVDIRIGKKNPMAAQ